MKMSYLFRQKSVKCNIAMEVVRLATYFFGSMRNWSLWWSMILMNFRYLWSSKIMLKILSASGTILSFSRAVPIHTLEASLIRIAGLDCASETTVGRLVIYLIKPLKVLLLLTKRSFLGLLNGKQSFCSPCETSDESRVILHANDNRTTVSLTPQCFHSHHWFHVIEIWLKNNCVDF